MAAANPAKRRRRSYLVTLPRPGAADIARQAVLDIPGVWPVGPYRASVPEDAIEVVQLTALRLCGSQLPIVDPPPALSFEPWAQTGRLPGPEGDVPFLRRGVWGGLTEYQREVVPFALRRRGSLLLWAAGCLAGDTEVVVNRRGCARRMKLAELVYKFNGGVTRGAVPPDGKPEDAPRNRWKLEYPTFTQSRAGDGTLRLNRIVAAVSSGVRKTFVVRLANGMTLRATADHRFLTQRGWVRLEHLQAHAGAPIDFHGGDFVYVDAGQSADASREPKAYYPQQGRHVAYKTGLSGVESITPFGEEETFDLTMEEPLDNFVANGMVVHNSGKSRAAVACTQASTHGVVVVVTLAGHLRFWRSEIDFACDAGVMLIDGREDRPAMLPRYLVISWEVLDAHVEWLSGLHLGWVVVDEAQRARDMRGVWSKAVRSVAEKAQRVQLLTATPFSNTVRDFYPLHEMLAPGAAGRFWPKDEGDGRVIPGWGVRYCAAHQETVEGVGQVWNTSGASNGAELASRIKFHMHKVTKARSHASLPPLRRIVHYVPSRELLADRMAKSERQRIQAADRISYPLIAAARRKRPYILNLLEEYLPPAGKILIFTGRHVDVEELGETVLQKFGKLPGLWVRAVHGGNTSGADRERIVGLRGPDGKYPADSYMGHPGPAVLVATADTLGTGTNLQDTDHLIQAMLPWSPGQVVQRENRVHRLGGTRRPVVHYVIAETTIDERVAGRLLEKLPPIGALTDSQEFQALAEDLDGLGDEEAILRGLVEATTRQEDVA